MTISFIRASLPAFAYLLTSIRKATVREGLTVATSRNLLSAPNGGKLGGSIFGWSIPAIRTCPGRSAVCESVCYADTGRFLTRKVQELNEWRYAQSKRKDFVDTMVEEIHRRGVIVLRVHVAGDYYSPAYARKWTEIALRSPQTTFFSYTRSWRVRPIYRWLEAMSCVPNVKLWFSADCETGIPVDVPERVRIAWLQHSTLPAPPGVDLVFQVKRVRAKPGQVSLPMVCGEETPEGKANGVTCSSCQLCWRH